MISSSEVSGISDSTLVTVSASVVLAVAIIVFLVGLGILLMRYYRLRIPGFGFIDRIRSFRYLVLFSNALMFRGVRDSERRSRTMELRGNLADAAEAEGMTQAIDKLGRPSHLAMSVIEDRPRPTWVAGLRATVIATFGAVFLHAILLNVWVSAVNAAGGVDTAGSVTLVPWAEFSYSSFTGDSSITSLWLAIIPSIAFVIWSRPWRLFFRRMGWAAGE